MNNKTLEEVGFNRSWRFGSEVAQMIVQLNFSGRKYELLGF